MLRLQQRIRVQRRRRSQLRATRMPRPQGQVSLLKGRRATLRMSTRRLYSSKRMKRPLRRKRRQLVLRTRRSRPLGIVKTSRRFNGNKPLTFRQGRPGRRAFFRRF